MWLRLRRPAWLRVPALARPVEAVAVAEVGVTLVALLPSNPMAVGEARLVVSPFFSWSSIVAQYASSCFISYAISVLRSLPLCRFSLSLVIMQTFCVSQQLLRC
jgi:hypothetical protein